MIDCPLVDWAVQLQSSNRLLERHQYMPPAAFSESGRQPFIGATHMYKVVLMFALVGCSAPLPPQDVTTVTVTRVAYTPARVYGQIISVEVIDPPLSTWITGDELQKLLLERHKKNVAAGLECEDGDPLCSTIP